MGGRGSSGKGGGGSGGSSQNTFSVPKLTSKQINALSRSELETLATALYANEAMKQGLTRDEGVRRARSLLSGNTTAQLKKYVSRRVK